MVPAHLLAMVILDLSPGKYSRESGSIAPETLNMQNTPGEAPGERRGVTTVVTTVVTTIMGIAIVAKVTTLKFHSTNAAAEGAGLKLGSVCMCEGGLAACCQTF